MDPYIVRKRSFIHIKLSYTTLCDLALLIYFCVMFAHQRENAIDTFLRYGSLFFIVAVYIWVYPPIKNLSQLQTIQISIFEIWMLLIILYGSFSMLWSIEAENAVKVLFNLGKTMIVCYLIRPHLTDRKSINRILLLILIALIYMMVLLLLRMPVSTWSSERVGDVLNQNPNEIGRLVCLGTVLILYFLSLHEKGRWIFISIFSLFCMVALMTGSKNAIFILIFQIGLYYFLISKKGKRILVVVAVMMGAYLLFYLFFYNEVLYGVIGRRLEGLLQLFVGGANIDGSTLERLYFMKTAWGVFQNNPMIGVGLNNFSAYLELIGYENAVYSHCGFLELLSTLGIVGFGLYYFMYVHVLKKLIKPAFEKDMLAVLLFVINLRVLLFDISSISMYTYNSYITLMIGFTFSQALSLEHKR